MTVLLFVIQLGSGSVSHEHIANETGVYEWHSDSSCIVAKLTPKFLSS